MKKIDNGYLCRHNISLGLLMVFLFSIAVIILVIANSRNILSADVANARSELRRLYGISEPMTTFTEDYAKNWKVCTVISKTDPAEYAVDYVRAYMSSENETHFVISYSGDSVTRITLEDVVVKARTSELSEREELYADKIGSGKEITNKVFDLLTGKEIR